MKIFTGDENRYLRIWAAIVMVLLIALGGTSTALVSDHSTSKHADTIANCVNDDLGDRNGLTAAQNQALIDQARSVESYAKAQLANGTALLGVLAAKPGNAQTAAFNTFVMVLRASGVSLQQFVANTDAYVTELTSIQAKRNAKPLGKC